MGITHYYCFMCRECLHEDNFPQCDNCDEQFQDADDDDSYSERYVCRYCLHNNFDVFEDKIKVIQKKNKEYLYFHIVKNRNCYKEYKEQNKKEFSEEFSSEFSEEFSEESK